MTVKQGSSDIHINMVNQDREARQKKKKNTYFSAAWQMAPHVSAISSTNMATRSLTSPTKTMDATSFAFLRSLWIKANSTLSRSAIDVTLCQGKQNVTHVAQRTLHHR